MTYQNIKNDINDLKDVFNDFGKLTDSILKRYNFPIIINDLIKEDIKLFEIIIDLIYNETSIHMNAGKMLNEILEIIEKGIIQISNNPKKQKYIKFNKIIFNWLKDTNFFLDIFDKNDTSNISFDEVKKFKEENDIDYSKIDKFIPRINQKEAFNRLDKYGLETGIHCQATGCGKTYNAR